MNPDGAKRLFLWGQWVLVIFILAETVLTWVLKLHEYGESTSSASFHLGNTALTPPIYITIVQLIAVLLIYVRHRIVRAIGVIISSALAILYALFWAFSTNITEGYSGGKAELITVSKWIGVILGVWIFFALCAWVILTVARRPRRRTATVRN